MEPDVTSGIDSMASLFDDSYDSVLECIDKKMRRKMGAQEESEAESSSDEDSQYFTGPTGELLKERKNEVAGSGAGKGT